MWRGTRRSESLPVVWSLGPAIFFGSITVGVPLVLLVTMSLQRFSIFGWEWIGFENYATVLTDDETWRVLWNTGKYVLWLVPSVTLGALAIALGIRGHKRQAYLRFVLFAPTLAAGAIIANFWRFIFSPEGGANWFLVALGLSAQPWLTYGGPTITAVSIVLWTSLVGSIVLIYSASLAGVPGEVLDAAAIDGATRGQTNRLILVPQILPTVSLVALLSGLVAFQHLETVLLLAPATFAGNVMFRVYQIAFSYSRHGEGAALGVFVLVVVVTLAWLKQRSEARHG